MGPAAPDTRGLRWPCVVLVVLAVAVLVGCEQSSPESTESESAHSHKEAPKVDELLETLASTDTAPEKKLAAIHRARDERVVQAVPHLRRLLEADEPALVVASAAALKVLEARQADTAIIEAAERLSRTRQLEHLRQILYIIGDIGGPEATQYLRAVSEAHQVPGIRRTAGQILERMASATEASGATK